jgi:hypothetical protein
MNSHYTGYEFELNQSRQASLRSEFEHQAQAKLLNESEPSEAFNPTRKQFRNSRRIVKIGFGLFSLLSVMLVLAYLVLLPAYPASAGQPTGSGKAEVVNQVGATPPLTMSVSNALPTGNYTLRIVAKDIPSLLRFDEPSVIKYQGDWGVSLNDQGNFTITQNDQVMMQGAFVVDQNQVTFTSDEGTPLCGTDPEETSATYQWFPVEEGIGMMPTSVDKCYARSLVFATHSLKLDSPIYNPVPAQTF